MKSAAQTRVDHRIRLLGAALIAGGAVWLSVSQAQDRRERPRPTEPAPEAPRERAQAEEARPEREFRIPQRERDGQEGTPEGMPQAQIAPPGDDVRPRLLPPNRWMLGVYAHNTETGVVITRVLPGSPAWEAGLEPQDKIVTVEGFQIGYVNGRLYPLGEELQHRAGPRGHVSLLVQNWRNNRLVNLDVDLERDLDFSTPRRRRQ